MLQRPSPAVHHGRWIAALIGPADPAMEERDPEEVPGDPRARGPGCACIRDPRRSYQLDRHDRQPVAAPPGEVDQLDVEDDARDPLRREQVVRGVAREPLEPALGVLDRADHPDRGEGVEHLAEQPPLGRAGSAHVGAVRLDPAAQRDVGGRRAPRRAAGSWSGGVAMSASANTTSSLSAASMPARTAAPLPPCGDAQQPTGRATARSTASRIPGGLARDRTRSAVPSVLPSSTTRTRSGPAGCPSPERPRGPGRPGGGGSRTARRGPGRAGSPR